MLMVTANRLRDFVEHQEGASWVRLWVAVVAILVQHEIKAFWYSVRQAVNGMARQMDIGV